MPTNMRISAILSISLLRICILSYGLAGAAYAQSQEPPLSVNTDFPAYAEDSTITISGKVKDSALAKNQTPVAIQVINPNGSIVGIAQIMLDSNNYWCFSFKH